MCSAMPDMVEYSPVLCNPGPQHHYFTMVVTNPFEPCQQYQRAMSRDN